MRAVSSLRSTVLALDERGFSQVAKSERVLMLFKRPMRIQIADCDLHLEDFVLTYSPHCDLRSRPSAQICCVFRDEYQLFLWKSRRQDAEHVSHSYAAIAVCNLCNLNKPQVRRKIAVPLVGARTAGRSMEHVELYKVDSSLEDPPASPGRNRLCFRRNFEFPLCVGSRQTTT